MKKFLLIAVAALLCGTLAAQEVEWPAALKGKYDTIVESGLQKDGKSKWYIVRKGNVWQLVDAKGNALLKETYDKILQNDFMSLATITDEQFEQGLYDGACKGHFIVVKNGKKALVNEDFKVITPLSYDYISGSVGNYYYEVKKDGVAGILSKEGDIVVPVKYKKFVNLDTRHSEFFVMENPSGKYCIFLPNEEKELGDFANVKRSGSKPVTIIVTNEKDSKKAKWAVMSPIDKVLSDCIFMQNFDESPNQLIVNGQRFCLCTPFINGKAFIQYFNENNEIYGNVRIMDAHGKIGPETEFCMAEDPNYLAGVDRKDCRIVVRKDDRIGFVDFDYKLAVPCRYLNASNFFVDKSLASTPIALVKEEGKIELIDPNGNVLHSFKNEASLPDSLKEIDWLFSEDMVTEIIEDGKTAD